MSLLRTDNAAGFKHVSYHKTGTKPFHVHVGRDGRRHQLGNFATAAEAALAVARFLGPEGLAAALAPPAPKAPMTVAEVHAAAEAEGLTLVRAENATGFRGVSSSQNDSKPFKAHAVAAEASSE